MEARCVNCKKVKPVFKRFDGQTKKRWCAGGHYTTKATCWCKDCWVAWEKKYQEDQDEQSRRNQEILNSIKS